MPALSLGEIGSYVVFKQKVVTDTNLNDANKKASAAAAGREFKTGLIRGKRLCLMELVYTEYCLNLLE